MVIFLDQCALSELALNREADARKDRLKELLLRLHGTGRLVCPLPDDAPPDSATLVDPHDREKIAAFQSALAQEHTSSGNGDTQCFKPLSRVLHEEVLALARPAAELISYESTAAARRESHEPSQSASDRLATLIPVMSISLTVAAVPMIAAGRNRAYSLFLDMLQEHTSHAFAQALHLLAGNPPDPQLYQSVGWAQYLRRHEATPQELGRLKAAFLRRRYEIIPALMTHCALKAHLIADYASHIPRAFCFATERAVQQMAVALNSSDVVITDRAFVEVIRKAYLLLDAICQQRRLPVLDRPEVFRVTQLEEATRAIEGMV